VRAPELVQYVEQAQRELRDEICAAIEAKINRVSEVTGLLVDGVEVGLIESTRLDSVAREWKVVAVRIRYDLPDMISMEYR